MEKQQQQQFMHRHDT